MNGTNEIKHNNPNLPSGISIAEILESLPLAMFCKDYSDGNGKFVAWNDAAEKLWGLKADTIVGKSDKDFFPANQAEIFRSADMQTLNSGQMLYIPEELVDSPNTGNTVVRTWKVPIKSKFLLGISQDLSEQRKIESQLESQRASAFIAAKFASLGEVAGSIAHEINNPLAILQALNEKIIQLHNSKNLDDSQIEKITSTAEEMILRIGSIVESLRRLNRNTSRDELQPSSITALMQESISLLKPTLTSEAVDLQLINPLDERNFIMCKESELSQVFLCMLNNARYAANQQKEKWIRIEINEIGSEIVIRFYDSGSGISRSIQDKMFDPFFTTKETGDGVGLGLSLAKKIVSEHKGSILYDGSQTNTCFVICLPKYNS